MTKLSVVEPAQASELRSLADDWLASVRAGGKSLRTLESYRWPVYQLFPPFCADQGGAKSSSPIPGPGRLRTGQGAPERGPDVHGGMSRHRASRRTPPGAHGAAWTPSLSRLPDRCPQLFVEALDGRMITGMRQVRGAHALDTPSPGR